MAENATTDIAKEPDTRPELSKNIIEAALFMSGEPLMLDDITKLFKEGTDKLTVLKAAEDLMQEFNSRGMTSEIIKTTEGKYHMKVRDDYLPAVSHLGIDPEFSKAELRCLGLIAVKQPVRQSIIVKIIGNKAYDYIKELIEKDFISGKKEANTKLLAVTPKFEAYFGKQAEDIKKSAAQS